jgi:flagellar basal-body rod modification protein FlgD
MASVSAPSGATNSDYSTASTSSTTGANNSSTAIAPGTSSLANQATFLQLLVAQLQNQDPLQPQDGTQFVTQLAQFTNLEQTLAMRSDMDSIKSKYVDSATASTGTSTSAV